MSTLQQPLLRLPTGPADREQSYRDAGHEPAIKLVSSTMLKRYVDGRLIQSKDMVAVEAPLHIHLSGHPEIVIARTPGDDIHLITGHLFSLGLIKSVDDLLGIQFTGNDKDQAVVSLKQYRRQDCILPIDAHLRIHPEELFLLRNQFEERQKLYHSTGSTHAAALFHRNGHMVAYGEDVSRHCAFDKAVGKAIARGALADADIAMLTSRLAQELTVKAAMANIPILCGFSAASSAGISFAQRNDITLIGRIRRDSFTVYVDSHRIYS
ncbi:MULTISPECIES: formate dehydrogenase accessory sulfurtransferase FdhD [unclassified Pseudodesulfovibrio]|uniref:formate dehydrogenase accessory sulfurtransferase FdhD n=1 Tax=unclassified Pseudodesulfovibrio TaxID=2661612 RepID=UPI000FEB6E56|nr:MULTISPECIES: formate dehydrogenase accessory sulfurtransferase FdhD [unclassified Pseudodesulfovibrio]MCJ2163998.1 formate dehydrogenase accessory sulfurtransferase FdhD [Pseudodesulfovibrio sp. S3-i]RWU05363.1 sufurtransferase FdhD [Pseudodesulfovibrio sp. S3]